MALRSRRRLGEEYPRGVGAEDGLRCQETVVRSDDAWGVAVSAGHHIGRGVWRRHEGQRGRRHPGLAQVSGQAPTQPILALESSLFPDLAQSVPQLTCLPLQLLS